MHSRSLLPIASLLSLAGSQLPQLQRLETLTGQLAESFNDITAVRELSDGTVIIVDAFSRRVFGGDFATTHAKQLGEQGFEQGQYLWPDRIFSIRGDTTLIRDAIEGRLHVIPPAWRSASGLEELAQREVRSANDGRFLVMFGDAAGNFYREIRLSDGVALERLSPNTTTDTIGLSRGVVDARARPVNSGGSHPFPGYDRWAVSPTGHVARVHVEAGFVELFPPDGKSVRSDQIGLDAIPVSDAIKSAWRAEYERPRILYRSMGSGKYGFVEESRKFTEPARWPRYLPAVTGRNILFDSFNRLWLERNTLDGAPVWYDVLGADGRLSMRVALDAGSRIVGFGNAAVFVAKRDKNGLERLSRFANPK